MLTRAQLERISEAQLRKDVLIPLFSAMGYSDVYEYHGGPLEQGKDIVMWKAGELRDRLNYAVVVKRKVNGRASGAGSAGEVVAQVEQCFASPYHDSRTGKQRKIDRCLVVVGNRIPTEFLNAAGTILERNGLARDTEYLNADQIWEWIKKYQPEKTIFDSIQQLQTLLSEQFPGFRAEIHLSEEKMTFNLKPIDSGATPPPQSIAFHISLEGEAGKQVRAEYERFIKAGSGFTISKEQIKGIEMSELLKKLYGLTEDKAVSFTFTPNPSAPVIWNFKRVCDEGYTAVLPGIQLRTIQAGTEEATLTNEHQNAPWLFTVVTRKDEGRLAFQFSYRTNLAAANCRQALDWFRFQHGLALPGKLVLEHAEYGIEFPTSDDPGSGEVPNPALVELLEKIVYIQLRTTVAIPYRGRFAESDIDEIEHLYEIVKTGRLPLNSMTALFDKAKIIANVDSFRAPGSLNVEINEEPVRKCLDVLFKLGPSRVIGHGVIIDRDSAARVKAEIDQATPGDSIELTLHAIDGGSLERVFPNWLSDSA